MTTKRWVCAIIMMMTLATLFSACGTDTKGGGVTLKVFANTGQPPEKAALIATFKAFEAKNPNIKLDVQYLTEDNYNQQVSSAAISRKMPCVMEINGPTLYNYVWSNYLTPIDSYVSDDLKSDMLSSIIKQGTYNNHLYSLGQFDAGLALYANKKDLEAAGVRIPAFGNPWTKSEFEDALAKLKNVSGVQYPLDLMMSYGIGEWFTFGFSPFLQSFGGDLIDRSNYQSANGVLNGSDSVAAMKWFQNLFNQKYVNPKPADDTSFSTGKSALAWVGHWQYPTYSKALGDNLIVLPAPDLGKGPKTGMGSWNWGITSNCQNPKEAGQLINFLLEPDQIKAMTTANAAVPARKSILASTPLFADGGALHVYVQQLEDSNIAVPRPLTPAYHTISTAFSKAVQNISTGADVKGELDKAVQTIDNDIKANHGYATK